MIRPLTCLSVVFVLAASLSAQPTEKPAESTADKSAPNAPFELPQAELDEEAVAELTRALEENESGDLYDKRSREYARAGQWSKAAADLRKAADKGDPSKRLMQAGICMLLAKDRMSYQKLVEDMLELYSESKNYYGTERTAKMCVLSKDPVGMRETAMELIDGSVGASGGSRWAQYFPSTQAIVRCRYGNHAAALDSIAASDKLNEQRGSSKDVIAINRFVEALCHAGLDDREKAQAAYDKGEAVLREAFADSGMLREHGFWTDFLIAEILRREAQSMLTKADETP